MRNTHFFSRAKKWTKSSNKRYYLKDFIIVIFYDYLSSIFLYYHGKIIENKASICPFVFVTIKSRVIA